MRKLVLAVFLLITVSIVGATYINDESFGLGNGAYVTLNNTTLDNLTCCSSDTLFLNISEKAVSFTAGTNKTVTNPTYSGDNFTFDISGTSGYFNFTYTMSNSSIGWYNYTGTYPTTISVVWNVVEPNSPPNITSWYNNVNGWNQTALNLNAGNTVNFNVTVNQTIDTISWSVEGIEEQNTSSLSFSRTFNTVDTLNVTAQAFNANGSSNIVYTVVDVLSTGGEGTDWDYAYGWVKYPNGTGINSATIYTEAGNTNTNSNGYYSFGYIFEHGSDYNFNVTKSGLNWTNQTISFATGDYEIVNATLENIYPTQYNISGYVLDDSGLNVSGATITYTGGSNTTTSTGYYIIQNILNGTYLFTASKTGYTSSSSTITIGGTNLTYQNFTLIVETPDTAQSSIENAYDAVRESNSNTLPILMRVFSIALLIFAFGIVFIQLRMEQPNPTIIVFGIITAVVGFAMLIMGNYLLYAIMNWSGN